MENICADKLHAGVSYGAGDPKLHVNESTIYTYRKVPSNKYTLKQGYVLTGYCDQRLAVTHPCIYPTDNGSLLLTQCSQQLIGHNYCE